MNIVWRDHKVKTYRGWIVSSVTFAFALALALIFKRVAFGKSENSNQIAQNSFDYY